MSLPPTPGVRADLGPRLVGHVLTPRYQRTGDVLWFEGARPDGGWHRHDWRPRAVLVAVPAPTVSGRPVRVVLVVIQRRRCLLYGTMETRQDHARDEINTLH